MLRFKRQDLARHPGLRWARRRLALALLALLTDLSAVAGTAEFEQVRYMMWDAAQLPAYRQCAADFERRNPRIRIRLRQAGWGDYWTAITMGFISDTAPDVFVNHLSAYPEMVQHQVLEDLAPLMARDGVQAQAYAPGLLEAWARAGRQYGLPKDWDSVALLVNMAHAKQQGVSLAALQAMRWNPQDGGSFERIVRQLSVDAQGRNALSPDYDARQVRVYGYQTPGAGGMAGQTEWSHFAVSNGFRFQDAPWRTPLHYDSPALAQTLDYLASLSAKGLSATPERLQGLGASALFASRQVAMIPEGSWMMNHYRRQLGFEHAWVVLPLGPSGQRATMRIGTADSIWAGSKVKAAAWQWVKYLGSPECQTTVARHGVVFPALRGVDAVALQALTQRGVDPTAFIHMAQSQTFLTPMVEHGAEISALLSGAIDQVLMGRAKAGPALRAASEKIQGLFTP